MEFVHQRILNCNTSPTYDIESGVLNFSKLKGTSNMQIEVLQSREQMACFGIDLFKVEHFKKSRIDKKAGVINDLLGQAHSLISSDHYFHSTFVSFCDIFKSGDGRTDGRKSVQK